MAYPVKVGPTGRYLVDQNNVPFLLAGDAPQGMIGDISTSDAQTYFAARAAQGFNAAWINLLCDSYTGCNSDGTTFDGVAPFTTPGDLSTPNDVYFQRADAVLQAAAQNGIVVFLDPIETGGWLNVLQNNGLTEARAYGQYVGQRYVNYDNIVWQHGNDFQSWQNSSDDALVKAVALGIQDVDTRHIHTIELSYNQSSTIDDPTWAGFVGLNAVYDYESIYARTYRDYNATNFLPNFLVESNYEGEQLAGAPHVTNEHDVRAEDYWIDLAGGIGFLYGNHFIWPFPSNWQQHLNDPGAVETLYVQNLLLPRAWYNLVPDQNHTVVTSGYGTFEDISDGTNNQDNDYAPTARTSDGSLVITYMPTARAVTVDMTQLSAATNASWYDPTLGTYSSIAGSPLANTGSHVFTPPASTHSDGSNDWVLVLEVN